jgi:hypothetical protein
MRTVNVENNKGKRNSLDKAKHRSDKCPYCNSIDSIYGGGNIELLETKKQLPNSYLNYYHCLDCDKKYNIEYSIVGLYSTQTDYNIERKNWFSKKRIPINDITLKTCPYCGSDDMHCDNSEHNKHNNFKRYFYCMECKKEWYQRFDITAYLNPRTDKQIMAIFKRAKLI